tara:strand:+ start:147 stop:836 length:690 start_codon:yes stop_codon:yes gene_type:complete
MAKGDAKTKAAKKMLEAEESSPSKVSMGQIRAAEEEQRMGRRGMDTGKKKKKIPSDPIEHIRTLYGTGKPNDRVKKARKRLYDRYVEQGKLEPIFPRYVEGLIRGEKIDEGHKKDRETALSGVDQLARSSDKRAEKHGKERSEYAKTGKSRTFDEIEHVRRDKQSNPNIAGHLEELAQHFGAQSQKAHEKHQEARLGDAEYYYNVTPEEREYTEELMAWRRKHGKKGKK